jgi:hypothetical protein
MAIHTIRWLKKAIETNTYWTSTFMLRKGTKWTDDWIEIINEPFECMINVIAKGMTSGLRGLNPDDWRPDFIFCDDISNEETVGTEDQRNKNYDLFFGALVPSLAPRSEAPSRKLVLAQTGLHKEDIIYRAHDDPSWQTVKYPKLLEPSPGMYKSTWEERFPTEEAVNERQDYIRRGQFHIYLREYGTKIISRETAPLQAEWLRKWTSLPTNLVYYLGLDPATDSQNPRAHKSAGAVIGVSPQTGDVYWISDFALRGKNPDELWVWYVQQQRQFRPRKSGVETVAFQRVLAWYFKQKMQESKQYFLIDEINDKRSKQERIIQAFTGLASNGKFWVHENHTDFIAGFTDWDGVSDWDLGDAGAQAVTLANPWMASSALDGDFSDSYEEEEKSIPDLEFEEVPFIRRPRDA